MTINPKSTEPYIRFGRRLLDSRLRGNDVGAGMMWVGE